MLRAGEQIGPYTLTNKIGQGALGVVWLAERRTAIAVTQVALKIPLDEEVNLEAIKQEAKLWAQASGHPNVLSIIEADVFNNHVVIASEYAPDGSLEALIKRTGGQPIPPKVAVAIIAGILSGLEHLHSKNIIHRDIKPANILLQGRIPRLADFGISRVLKTTSHTGAMAGTPLYMAPEAFDGKRSEQTDLWSVGVILYQLLSGRLPFPQTDMTSLIGAIVGKEPAPLPDEISPHLKAIVAKVLQKNPAHRFKSAAEMQYALRTSSRPLTDKRPSSSLRADVRDTQKMYQGPNKKLLFGGAGLLALAGLAFVFWLNPFGNKEGAAGLQSRIPAIKQIAQENSDQTAGGPTPVPAENVLPPVATASISNYSGTIGNTPYVFSLSWNKNQTVTGSYYSDHTPSVVYTLSGVNFKEGEAEIKAYRENQAVGTMLLHKNIGGGKVCWIGTFQPLAGETSPMTFCRLR